MGAVWLSVNLVMTESLVFRGVVNCRTQPRDDGLVSRVHAPTLPRETEDLHGFFIPLSKTVTKCIPLHSVSTLVIT